MQLLIEFRAEVRDDYTRLPSLEQKLEEGLAGSLFWKPQVKLKRKTKITGFIKNPYELSEFLKGVSFSTTREETSWQKPVPDIFVTYFPCLMYPERPGRCPYEKQSLCLWTSRNCFWTQQFHRLHVGSDSLENIITSRFYCGCYGLHTCYFDLRFWQRRVIKGLEI